MARGDLTKVVSMRLSGDDAKLLQATSALVPVIPRLTLARVAMRLGLEAIQDDPTKALESGAVRTKRRK